MKKAPYVRRFDGSHVWLTIKGQDLQVAAGRDDQINVYQDRDTTYVLSSRESLSYVGLECYNNQGGTLILFSEVFLQGGQVDELSSDLPKKDIFSYAPANQIKILGQWID